ncbi:hypothetical protein ScPMuIL_000871 [Solemya velum]
MSRPTLTSHRNVPCCWKCRGSQRLVVSVPTLVRQVLQRADRPATWSISDADNVNINTGRRGDGRLRSLSISDADNVNINTGRRPVINSVPLLRPVNFIREIVQRVDRRMPTNLVISDADEVRINGNTGLRGLRNALVRPATFVRNVLRRGDHQRSSSVSISDADHVTINGLGGAINRLGGRRFGNGMDSDFDHLDSSDDGRSLLRLRSGITGLGNGLISGIGGAVQNLAGNILPTSNNIRLVNLPIVSAVGNVIG